MVCDSHCRLPKAYFRAHAVAVIMPPALDLRPAMPLVSKQTFYCMKICMDSREHVFHTVVTFCERV